MPPLIDTEEYRSKCNLEVNGRNEVGSAESKVPVNYLREIFSQIIKDSSAAQGKCWHYER